VIWDIHLYGNLAIVPEHQIEFDYLRLRLRNRKWTDRKRVERYRNIFTFRTGDPWFVLPKHSVDYDRLISGNESWEGSGTFNFII